MYTAFFGLAVDTRKNESSAASYREDIPLFQLIRERVCGKVVNVHRSKKRISETEDIETERRIDNNLYEQMLQQADPYRSTIKKKRQSFIWKGQFFEIDTFLSPVNNLVMMETKGIAQQETVNFPPFVKVLEDVTGNPRYLNYNIALTR